MPCPYPGKPDRASITLETLRMWNLAQHTGWLPRERNAEIVAAVFGTRDGRIVQRHSNDHDIADAGAPFSQPGDERVVGIKEPRIGVGREDPM